MLILCMKHTGDFLLPVLKIIKRGIPYAKITEK